MREDPLLVEFMSVGDQEQLDIDPGLLGDGREHMVDLVRTIRGDDHRACRSCGVCVRDVQLRP